MALTSTHLVEQEEFTPESFHASNVLDATTALLAALNCPPKIRPMMGAILGLTAGRASSVTFYRTDIVVRLYGGPYRLPEDELARGLARVTRQLSRMREWIRSEELDDVITYTHGTKDERGRIKTRLIRWIADLAAAADAELSPRADEDGNSPTVSDVTRRAHLRKEAQALVAKRLRRDGRQRRGAESKRKETTNATKMLRLGLGFLRSYAKAASFSEDAAAVSAMLHYQIDELVAALCAENRREETASNVTLVTPKKRDVDETWDELTDDKIQQEDIETCAENCVPGEQGRDIGQGRMAPEAWEDELPVDEPYDAMAGNSEPMGPIVEMPIDERQVERSTCLPYVPELSADVLSVMAAASGKEDEHWRALYAAATVGSMPVAILIGGNGEPGAGSRGWRIGSGPKEMPLRELLRRFDELIAEARRKRHSFIVSFDKPLLIRDDCSDADVERLADMALFVTRTSPGSHHVFLAVPDVQTDEQMKTFHAALDARGIGGNVGSRRAARWAGTWNAKRGSEVRLIHCEPGRVLTREYLAGLGIDIHANVALPAEPYNAVVANVAQRRVVSSGTPWPSYERELATHLHPMSHPEKPGKPDRSAADASFFRISLMRGFSLDDIAHKLVAVSERARRRGIDATKSEVVSMNKRWCEQKAGGR